MSEDWFAVEMFGSEPAKILPPFRKLHLPEVQPISRENDDGWRGEEENVSLAQSFNDDKTTSGCLSKISPLNLMVNTGAFQKTKLDVKKL